MTPGARVLIGAPVLFATIALGTAAGAQQAERTYKIGVLASSAPAGARPLFDALLDELKRLGYVEGRNLTLVQRWTEGAGEPLHSMADDLVARQRVDLILAWGTPATQAAKRATPKVPIVMVGVGDPVGTGLVGSLSRPGGNVTGVSNLARDASGKVMALLKEIVPSASRFAVVRNPGNPVAALFLAETQEAARSMRIDLEIIDVSTPEALESAFAVVTRERCAGVVFLAEPMILTHRKRIAESALRARVLTAFARRENVEAGGLLSYGPNLVATFRRAAHYVDRIFNGANPGDLPVEQPTTLELVVNVKTAKALGLTIPPSLLLRADHVIE